MSNRTDVATHPSLSLPSFAQAFSTSSINSISNSGNALPPIQSQSHPTSPSINSRSGDTPLHHVPRRVDQNRASRKRTLRESSDSTPSKSPSDISVKEEPDREDLDQASASSNSQSKHYLPSWEANEDTGPSSSKSGRTPKRRRVTISNIDTDVKRAASSDTNTPVSPVFMGIFAGDDPSAMEQVRSMLNLKQQQKALIEQRRNSNAGLTGTASPGAGAPPPTVHVVNGPETRHAATAPRSSSIAVPSNPRRAAINNHNNSTARNPSPSSNVTASQPHHASQQDTQPGPSITHTQPGPSMIHTQPGSSMTHAQPGPSMATHALPLPPISFAHRRAGRLGAKSKPADIMISPREMQASEQFQPSIMSAPPAPHGGSYGPGRFAMAIPSLPPTVISGQANTRVTRNVVPPTPTRLGVPRTANASLGRPSPHQVMPIGKSPPTASVPISSTLVPPTPSSLHRPHYNSEKTAFLAPFEMFYDALSDAKQLKAWLGEQLQKSNTLINSMQKPDHIEELVQSLVEKKIAGMREEIYGLRRRVEELEHALRIAQGPGHQHQSGSMSAGKGKARVTELTSEAPESYTFPPVPIPVKKLEPLKGMSSPSRPDVDGGSAPGSQTGSPAPSDAGRRLSVSSVRFDTRPGSSIGERPHTQGSREGFSTLTPPSKLAKVNRSPVNKVLLPRPPMHRQHSQSANPQAPSGSRKSGLTDKNPDASEDPNFNDSGK